MNTDKTAIRVPDSSRLSAVQRLCDIETPYLSSPELDGLLVDAMREITSWHRDGSDFYRKRLAAAGLDSGDIRTINDLARIPLVPANFFKMHEVVSVPRSSISLNLTSSGTTGQKSQMFFDNWSIKSAQRMVDWIFAFHGWITPEIPCNYLLYSYQTEQDSRLGTAFTDNYLCKYAPVREVFTALRLTGSGAHEFDVFGTIAALERFAASGEPVRIFGFPAFLYFTLERMQKLGMQPLALHPESLVFLGGGWKGHADKAIEKSDLYHRITSQLGIPDVRLRDGFGSVEHCVPYIECRCHQFHVPVWSRVIVRDVVTLKPLNFGQVGFLSFISPYITSVPAHAVLMGDLASLHAPHECDCGLQTPYFRIIGRAGTSKNKSCAVAAAELLRRPL
jgi:phenylacetate-coenzyme A ligase PaaK-like adenylate-forming protein